MTVETKTVEIVWQWRRGLRRWVCEMPDGSELVVQQHVKGRRVHWTVNVATPFFGAEVHPDRHFNHPDDGEAFALERYRKLVKAAVARGRRGRA